MLARSLTVAVAVHLAVGLGMADTVGRAPATVPAAAELPDAAGDLATARDGLSTASSAVRRAARSLEDADLAVAAADTALRDLDDELVRAQEARATAAARERVTALATERANGRLDDVLDEHHTSRARLQDRAVELFKHGPAVPGATLLGGVLAAGDWHDVAVTVETVSRIVARDRDLVATTGELTRDVATARSDVADTRRQAVHRARDTADEARRIERLRERRRGALDELEKRRTELAQVLRELEADVALRRTVVATLEADAARTDLSASRVLVPVVARLGDRPPPDWLGRLPAHGQPWATTIDGIAASRGVDGRLLAALVWTESGFRPDARSHAGALGLAQLMPGTAAGLGVDPFDPVHNLDGGARYLRTQLQRFDRVDLALAAYNAGPDRVRRAGPGIPDILETQLYVVRVLERYELLTGG